MYECGPVVGGEVRGPGWSGRWRAGCAACKGRHGGHLAYTTTTFLPARSFGNYRGLELSLKSMLYLGKGARGGHLANTKTTFLSEVSVTIWCLERSLNFKDRFFQG